MRPNRGESGITDPNGTTPPSTSATRRRVLATTAGAGIASIAGTSQARGTSSAGGNERWRFKMKYPRSTSPTVVDGTVYVGCGKGAYALDGDSGEERWRFDRRWVERQSWDPERGYYSDPERRYDSADPILGALQVVDGTVYVPGRGVYALDQETGEQLWHSEDHTEIGGFVASSPTVSQGTVYLGNGSIVGAWNTAVGKLQWSNGRDGGVTTSPVVTDGTVYATGFHPTLLAFDSETGDEEWHFVFEKGEKSRVVYPSSPTVADGTLYVYMAGFVLGLDPDTGQERLRFDPGWYIRSELTVVDETLYAVGGTLYAEEDNGRVAAFDTAEGEKRWQFEPPNPIHSSPTVAGDTLFVGSDDGFLYALDVADGSERWRFEADAEIRSAPIVVDGIVYVTDTAGTVYALYAGVRGSSEDSRVLFGTENHHHVWAEEASTDVASDEFVVDLDATPSTVTTGDEIRVQITITNVGDETGRRDVYYHGPGSFGGPVELEGGESQTIELSETVENPPISTPVHERGDEITIRNEITLSVRIFEDEDSLTIPVEEPSDNQVPGFGPLGALGGLGGAGYLLNRRTDE